MVDCRALYDDVDLLCEDGVDPGDVEERQVEVCSSRNWTEKSTQSLGVWHGSKREMARCKSLAALVDPNRHGLRSVCNRGPVGRACEARESPSLLSVPASAWGPFHNL